MWLDEGIFISIQIQHMNRSLGSKESAVLLHFSSQQGNLLVPAIDLIRSAHQDGDEVNATLIYSRKMDIEVEPGTLPQIPYLDIIKNIY